MFKTTNMEAQHQYYPGTKTLFINPSQEHKYTLIFLHGLGGDSACMLPWFDEPIFNLHTKMVFPQGPNRAITCGGGEKCNGWYDIMYNSHSRP